MASLTGLVKATAAQDCGNAFCVDDGIPTFDEMHVAAVSVVSDAGDFDAKDFEVLVLAYVATYQATAARLYAAAVGMGNA